MNNGLFMRSFLTLGDAPRLPCDLGTGLGSVAEVKTVEGPEVDLGRANPFSGMGGAILWINILNFYSHFVLS